MNLRKDLDELIQNQIITGEVATRIEMYYDQKENQSGNRFFIAFGILGAILVGLGIILIIAHNWDELSRTAKTAFSFFPLLLTQALGLYVFFRKRGSVTWCESTATLLVFAIGSCIALISQIYHISGDFNEFLLTWLLLGLPVIYILNASAAAYLYLIGITVYGSLVGYSAVSDPLHYMYWLLLVSIIPFYYLKLRDTPDSNFLSLLHWMVPLSVTICLGTIGHSDQLLTITYMSFFGLLYLFGSNSFFGYKKLISNGYLVIGTSGTLYLLFYLSFSDYWNSLANDFSNGGLLFNSPAFWTGIVLAIVTFVLSIKYDQLNQWVKDPFRLVYLVFIPILTFGYWTTFALLSINFLILYIGITTILKGSKNNHLGHLNFGMLIVAVLIICRFFDRDLSFIIRGLMFVSVGIGFFVTNYLVLRKK